MKKFIAILLVGITLLFALSSCKKKAPETVTTGEPETTAPAPTTSKYVTQGIESKDDGWSFWSQF